MEDRNLAIEFYREPPRSYQYHQIDSHHPLEHKLCVIKTLQHRVYIGLYFQALFSESPELKKPFGWKVKHLQGNKQSS